MNKPSREFRHAYAICALLHGLTEDAQFWWDSSDAYLRQFAPKNGWENADLVSAYMKDGDYSRWNNAWARAFLSQFEGEVRKIDVLVTATRKGAT